MRSYKVFYILFTLVMSLRVIIKLYKFVADSPTLVQFVTLLFPVMLFIVGVYKLWRLRK